VKANQLILPTIVISQFCCTSLWFAGNGVMHDLVINFGLEENALGHLTSAVQFGFIIGTLVFAFFTVADRFSPSKVFLYSALLGAAFNIGTVWDNNNLLTILSFRFMTGFFLAGIYPIGMKIAADYYEKGLGKSLGYLVGALVIGTALPHLLKDLTGFLPWKSVLIVTSSLAIFGGLLMNFLVPDGPYRQPGQGLDTTAFLNTFRNRPFRSAAFGYFGHMWELYAFWAFVPVMLKTYNLAHTESTMNIPLLSFLIIGIGSLACVLSGHLSQIAGTKRIAKIALMLSGFCCIVSPLIFTTANEVLFVVFLMFWGMVVIADSPLFSTLVSKNAPIEFRGTALTIVNCIGFSITIISIQLIDVMTSFLGSTNIYVILAIGPLLGLVALKNKNSQQLAN
jgi:MFS family permease